MLVGQADTLMSAKPRSQVRIVGCVLHDLAFFLICAVLGLTIPAALGAMMIMLFWPGDLTPAWSHVLSPCANSAGLSGLRKDFARQRVGLLMRMNR
jgi:hypothetical protein